MMSISILLITPSMYPKRVGGVGRVVYEIGREFHKEGHDVYVLSVDEVPRLERKGFLTPSFIIGGSLKQIASMEKFDVVHAHGFPAAIPAFFSRARIKVLTYHGPYSERIFQLHGKIPGVIAYMLERFMINRFDAVTCVSRAAIKKYQKRNIRMLYIPNGVNISRIDSVKKSIKLQNPQILYVGRHSWEKGYHILRSAEKKLGKKVLYLYNVPWETVIAYMRGSDVIVIPSIDEGNPLVLLEAMALNKRIVATTVGDIPYILGNHGVLIPPNDVMALVEGIKKALNMPEPNTRKIIEAKYTWQKISKMYLSLYGSLLKQ